jgi:hypothetical protein
LGFPFSIAREAQHYWLRYSADNELCRAAALSIPSEHFSLHAEDYLVQDGAQIATDRLPKLTWTSLRDFVQLRLPRANLAGRLQVKQIAAWELQRGGKEQAADAALYDAVALNQWLTSASAVRLASLRFCAAAIAHDTANARNYNATIVFVVGNPLPPIPCQFLCKLGRIFIPRWLPLGPQSRLIYCRAVVWRAARSMAFVDGRLRMVVTHRESLPPVISRVVAGNIEGNVDEQLA